MELETAARTLSGLSHPARLSVIRLLVQAGPEGMPAGALAEHLEMLPNTLSANLRTLLHAGLVTSVREGRSIRYFADYDCLREVIGFLLEDCCCGVDACRPKRATEVFKC